ncbi:MAG: multicopper oxidase domain-containing protein [Pseudomonadota bacterium]
MGTALFQADDQTKTYPQENALAIPALIDSRSAGNAIKLVIQKGNHEFFPTVESATKGFGQSFLGPTIRLYKGKETRIDFVNALDEPTTVHGHGLHVAGDVDGGPQSKILPGETKSVVLPIVQEAGTSWYHPHLMGKTAEHVHAGLAGLYLIEDANSLALPLPKNYGVDDIPLIVQDRSFAQGKMQPYNVTGAQHFDGLREETLIVNGTINAYHKVPQGWVRLRLLNGSNARFYRFFFADDVPFYKIATEGGFLNKPVTITELIMAPGERNEIMIDLANHETLSLMAEFLPADPDENIQSNYPVQGVVALQSDAALPSAGTLPKKLNDIRYFDQEDRQAAIEREIFLNMDDDVKHTDPHNMFGINDEPMNMAVINERVKKGDLELWTVTGEMMPHPFHIHGVSFQIVTHNGAPPAEEDRGWKDTVIVSGEPTTLLMQFHHTATEEFPYMYHCHILEHEDAGMMGQFTVTN